MSITRNQANTNTTAQQTAIQTAADAIFIAAADAAIANAINFGKFTTTVSTFKGVNIQTVYYYYANLGYGVSFPDVPNNLYANPAELFGFFLDQYYNNYIASLRLSNPLRITLYWGNFTYYPPKYEDEV